MVHWKKICAKEYSSRNPRPQFIAQVFASPRGFDWAWGVWHERGVDAGIEITFRGAKHRAEEAIEKLMGAEPSAERKG